MNQEVILAKLSTAFAVLALLIACVGLYGTMADAVARRTSEIGIRMALGARTSDVLRMTARRGCVLGGIGVGIGFLVATPLAFLQAGMAPAMPSGERATIVLAAGVLLLLVTLLASYIPARRATRIDPTVALRCE
jgi:ABC-type antimicrobial peptide transport system permease subunit